MVVAEAAVRGAAGGFVEEGAGLAAAEAAGRGSAGVWGRAGAASQWSCWMRSYSKWS